MDYLSSGFSRVDSSQDPGVFFSCLQTLCSLPCFQGYKEKSFRLLNLRNGSRILEIGCGLGQDAMAMSRITGERGRVVAVDTSRRMLEAACRSPRETVETTEPVKPAKGEALRFFLADACHLPFRGGSFDGARADRVLQHISKPGKALSEMVRTVKEGGRVVVYEPDWGTYIISPGEKEISRTMTQLFGDTFPSGWIGRQLPGLFRQVGLQEIQVETVTFFTDNLALADQIFDLANNARRAASMGYVSPDRAEGWMQGLERAHRQGSFFSSVTGFLVWGEKVRDKPHRG